MITAQVFQDISVQQMNAIAQACGFGTHVDGDGDLWINVAGGSTIVGLVNDPGRGFFMTSLKQPVTPAHANGYHKRGAGWCSVHVNDGRVTLVRWFVAFGATRDHMAQELFFWEAYVKQFYAYFGADPS